MLLVWIFTQVKTSYVKQCLSFIEDKAKLFFDCTINNIEV